MLNQDRPDPVRSPLLDSLSGHAIRHGYFTRQGGVSSGIYRSLNTGTGSDDEPERVQENRRRVAEWMRVSPDRLLTCHQIHSPDVIVATGPFPGTRPRADALVICRALYTSAIDRLVTRAKARRIPVRLLVLYAGFSLA